MNYALLPNHFHILLKANSKKSIPKMMMKLLISHSRYICTKYNFVGSIFQDRYKAFEIEDLRQLIVVSRYIHRNPIEFFEICDNIEEYKWSSFKEFIVPNLIDGIINRASKRIILKHFKNIKSYIEFVNSDELKTLEWLKHSI
jgi:putative transposase